MTTFTQLLVEEDFKNKICNIIPINYPVNLHKFTIDSFCTRLPDLFFNYKYNAQSCDPSLSSSAIFFFH